MPADVSFDPYGQEAAGPHRQGTADALGRGAAEVEPPVEPDGPHDGEPEAADDCGPDVRGYEQPDAPDILGHEEPDAAGPHGYDEPDTRGATALAGAEAGVVAPEDSGHGEPGVPQSVPHGFRGRGEPEDAGRDLSGDGTATPVSGFQALLPLPAAPPAERPAPPAERPAQPSPRVGPPSQRVIPPAEWKPTSPRTGSSSGGRIAPPGEWHLPSRPDLAASGGGAVAGSAGNGNAVNGRPGHDTAGGSAGSTGTTLAEPRTRDGDGGGDGPDTAVGATLPADPLERPGYRRSSRTRILAGMAAVAILGVTGVTGTLVVMHRHQAVASVPATTSAAASGTSSHAGAGEAGSARPTPPAAQWSSPVPVDPQTLQASSAQITGLACPKRTVCYATDSAGTVLSLQSGGTWPVANTDPNGHLIAISCSSSRFCLTVDAAGDAIPLNRGVWGSPALVGSGSGTLTSVSCAGPFFCVAVDNIGVAFTYRGAVTGWSQQAVDPSGQSLNSVSCASSTYCVAVSASGNVFTYDGTSWSGPQAVDVGHDLLSVSCPSTSFCMAVDSSGQAAEHIDGQWGLKPIGRPAAAVSCPSAGSCLAVGHSGATETYANGLWTQVPAATPSAAITTLSCAAATACVATDQGNNVLFYAPPQSG